jgi:hypothetical protein
MKTIKIDELNKIIAEVEEEHPYKQSGNRDSYSQYNEGWSDALGTLQGKIEAIGTKSSIKRLDELTDFVQYSDPERPEEYREDGMYEKGFIAGAARLSYLLSKEEGLFLGEKPIDKVTVGRLDVALRLCSIQIDRATLDRVIDVVELLEEKGGETSLEDICDLQSEWKGRCT